MTRRDREALLIQVALILVTEGVKNAAPGGLHAAAMLASEAAKHFVADLLPISKRKETKSRA